MPLSSCFGLQLRHARGKPNALPEDERLGAAQQVLGRDLGLPAHTARDSELRMQLDELQRENTALRAACLRSNQHPSATGTAQAPNTYLYTAGKLDSYDKKSVGDGGSISLCPSVCMGSSGLQQTLSYAIQQSNSRKASSPHTSGSHGYELLKLCVAPHTKSQSHASSTSPLLALDRLKSEAAEQPVALLVFEPALEGMQLGHPTKDKTGMHSPSDPGTPSALRSLFQFCQLQGGQEPESPSAMSHSEPALNPALPDSSVTVHCNWLGKGLVNVIGAESEAAGLRCLDSCLTDRLTTNRMVEGFCRNLVHDQSHAVQWWDSAPGHGLAAGGLCMYTLWPCMVASDRQGSDATHTSAALLHLEPVQLNPGLMQSFLAAAVAPCMITVVDPGGAIRLQNPESCARIGCHAPFPGQDGRTAPGDRSFNYLKELFMGQQEELNRMHEAVAQQHVYEGRVRVNSAFLARWMGLGADEAVWHQCQVCPLRDPVTQQPLLSISQIEVTEMVEAQQQVAHLQDQQGALLQEILPRQVLAHLLHHTSDEDLSLTSRMGGSSTVSNEVQRRSPSRFLPSDLTSHLTSQGTDTAMQLHPAVSHAFSSQLSGLQTTGLTSSLTSNAPRLSSLTPHRLSKSNISHDASLLASSLQASFLDSTPDNTPDAGSFAPTNVGLIRALVERSTSDAAIAPSARRHSHCAFVSGPRANVADSTNEEQRGNNCKQQQQQQPSFGTLLQALYHSELSPKLDGRHSLGHTRRNSLVVSRRCSSTDVGGAQTPQTMATCSSLHAVSRSESPGPGQRSAFMQEHQRDPTADGDASGHAVGTKQIHMAPPAQLTLTKDAASGESTSPVGSVKQPLQETPCRVWLTQQDVMSLATNHDGVTILFADIKGFTAMSEQLHPSQVMLFLNRLYSVWDSLLEAFGVYKVETIGDAYMCATGLFTCDPVTGGQRLGGYDPNHCIKMVQFAQAMLWSSQSIKTPLGEPVQVRIGIHSGPCSSGVVGQRMPRFCLFGDTVNTASRMESNGHPGCIHVSQATYQHCSGLEWQPTGGVAVKGKGVLQTWLMCVLPMGMEALKQLAANAADAAADGRPSADGNKNATNREVQTQTSSGQVMQFDGMAAMLTPVTAPNSMADKPSKTLDDKLHRLDSASCQLSGSTSCQLGARCADRAFNSGSSTAIIAHALSSDTSQPSSPGPVEGAHWLDAMHPEAAVCLAPRQYSVYGMSTGGQLQYSLGGAACIGHALLALSTEPPASVSGGERLLNAATSLVPLRKTIDGEDLNAASAVADGVQGYDALADPSTEAGSSLTRANIEANNMLRVKRPSLGPGQRDFDTASWAVASLQDELDLSLPLKVIDTISSAAPERQRTFDLRWSEAGVGNEHMLLNETTAELAANRVSGAFANNWGENLVPSSRRENGTAVHDSAFTLLGVKNIEYIDRVTSNVLNQLQESRRSVGLPHSIEHGVSSAVHSPHSKPLCTLQRIARTPSRNDATSVQAPGSTLLVQSPSLPRRQRPGVRTSLEQTMSGSGPLPLPMGDGMRNNRASLGERSPRSAWWTYGGHKRRNSFEQNVIGTDVAVIGTGDDLEEQMAKCGMQQTWPRALATPSWT